MIILYFLLVTIVLSTILVIHKDSKNEYWIEYFRKKELDLSNRLDIVEAKYYENEYKSLREIAEENKKSAMSRPINKKLFTKVKKQIKKLS